MRKSTSESGALNFHGTNATILTESSGERPPGARRLETRRDDLIYALAITASRQTFSSLRPSRGARPAKKY